MTGTNHLRSTDQGYERQMIEENFPIRDSTARAEP